MHHYISGGTTFVEGDDPHEGDEDQGTNWASGADYDPQEGVWHDTTMAGADRQRVPCQLSYQTRGNKLHSWLKLSPVGKGPMTVHASINLDELRREVEPHMRAALAKRMGLKGNGAVSGWGFMKKLKRKVRHAVKKIGKMKVIRKVVKVAQKALNNPLVTAALASNPYGQMFLAARSAARIAAKAIKGSQKAKHAIRAVVHAAKTKRSPKAQQMVKMFAEAIRKLKKSQAAYARFAGDDDMLLAAMNEPPVSVGCDSWHSGGPDAELAAELETLNSNVTAAAGAWDGVRWIADSLAPHSMLTHPPTLTARGALLSGRAAMAARFV